MSNGINKTYCSYTTVQKSGVVKISRCFFREDSYTHASLEKALFSYFKSIIKQKAGEPTLLLLHSVGERNRYA